MLENLKKLVYEANLALVKHHLVILTWGNVSMLDEKTQYVVIKPSGVDYDAMTKNDMVVVDLDGNVIEGALKPSSDTLTHLAIYKAYKEVKSVVHTHSKFATIFAQAEKAIIPLGTTHADYFYHDILVTRLLTDSEIQTDYERNTGNVIVETYQQAKIHPLECPAILVAQHGPFTFGSTAAQAVENALVLETISEMALHTLALKQDAPPMQSSLMEKHYQRKHGKNAYYGQNKK